jgi:hypothetical protein
MANDSFSSEYGIHALFENFAGSGSPSVLMPLVMDSGWSEEESTMITHIIRCSAVPFEQIERSPGVTTSAWK